MCFPALSNCTNHGLKSRDIILLFRALSLLLACNTFYWTVGILQCSLESAALIVGIESAVLMGVLSL